MNVDRQTKQHVCLSLLLEICNLTTSFDNLICNSLAALCLWVVVSLESFSYQHGVTYLATQIRKSGGSREAVSCVRLVDTLGKNHLSCKRRLHIEWED